MKKNISELVENYFPKNKNFVLVSIKNKKRDINGNNIFICDFHYLDVGRDLNITVLTNYNNIFSELFIIRQNNAGNLRINDDIDVLQEYINFYLNKENIKKEIILKILE